MLLFSTLLWRLCAYQVAEKGGKPLACARGSERWPCVYIKVQNHDYKGVVFQAYFRILLGPKHEAPEHHR